jgi:hypothetical protein
MRTPLRVRALKAGVDSIVASMTQLPATVISHETTHENEWYHTKNSSGTEISGNVNTSFHIQASHSRRESHHECKT